LVVRRALTQLVVISDGICCWGVATKKMFWLLLAFIFLTPRLFLEKVASLADKRRHTHTEAELHKHTTRNLHTKGSFFFNF